MEIQFLCKSYELINPVAIILIHIVNLHFKIENIKEARIFNSIFLVTIIKWNLCLIHN